MRTLQISNNQPLNYLLERPMALGLFVVMLLDLVGYARSASQETAPAQGPAGRSLSMPASAIARGAATIGIGAAGGLAFFVLNLPLPWVLGSVTASALITQIPPFRRAFPPHGAAVPW